MTDIFYLLAVGLFLIGSVIGYFVRQGLAQKQVGSAEAKAAKIFDEAKNEAREILIAAKDKATKFFEESRVQLLKSEDRLTKKEEALETKLSNLENQKKTLGQTQADFVQSREKLTKEFERLAGLTKEEAKNELIVQIEKENKEDLWTRIKKLEKENLEEYEKKARELLTLVVQRYASAQTAEVSTTTVNLPSDDFKAKIIGKEGRNIRALEKATGVEILIDETPEAITISSFDSVRRQIAKLALEKLIADGRIQPARIEELTKKAEEEIQEKIKKAGEEAAYELGILDLHPQLVHLLGRLKFRTSYSQNVLTHSIELAHIGGMLAAELGADVRVVKKASLLHDIGKAVDHEVEGTHVEIGRKILEKFGVEKAVIQAMQSHHEEYPYETLESRILQTADAISASRPGARRGTLETYIKRLEGLETIANSFAGVKKAYAIQAGREIRVFVRPEEIDDLTARKLARDIANRIESELKYPGEIKVNVIRESRVIEFAR